VRSLRIVADLVQTGGLAEIEAELIARRRKLATSAVIAGLAILVMLGGITTPTFLTLSNLLVVVRNASITGIVALGMSYVTISGNMFALSAEELSILSACIFGWLMRAKFGLAISLVATLVFAGIGGAVQGSIIALGGDPIITTLAFGGLFRGFASVVSQNQNILLGTDAAQWLGTGRPLGVPTQSWAFAILTLIAWFVLQKTRIGRLLLLSGASRAAATASGLRVGQAALLGISLLGICCGIAGIFAAAQFGQAVANLFQGLNFDVIAAILVGGIALRGGQGSPIQAALGATFISLLENFMLLHDFTTGWRTAVVGALVAAATCTFHVLQRRRL
jgi:ribose transport system permease protein